MPKTYMRSRSLEFPVGNAAQFSAPPITKQDVEILHYKVGRTLGEGTYGKVKLGVDTRTNTKVWT
jgi:serine/threonine protein kinase